VELSPAIPSCPCSRGRDSAERGRLDAEGQGPLGVRCHHCLSAETMRQLHSAPGWQREPPAPQGALGGTPGWRAPSRRTHRAPWSPRPVGRRGRTSPGCSSPTRCRGVVRSHGRGVEVVILHRFFFAKDWSYQHPLPPIGKGTAFYQPTGHQYGAFSVLPLPAKPQNFGCLSFDRGHTSRVKK